MKLLIFGILLLAVPLLTRAEDDEADTVDETEEKTDVAPPPSTMMLRTSYCACRCCEKNQDICFRHDSIPATYKCSESACNEKFCEAWEKAKCMKDCFCKECKDHIEKDDYRCITYKEIRPGCDCSKEEVQCGHKQPEYKEMNKGVKDMSQVVKKRKCVLPCFCQVCKDGIPPGMYTDCIMGELPEECDCSDVKCPSEKVFAGLKQVREMRERNKDKNSYDFAGEIDQMMPPDKAKVLKCKMQCYCDICSVGNVNVESNCDQMAPKPRVEGCDCDLDQITCPSNDIDQHCKIYCFCKGCIDDPRMSKTYAESCKSMTKEEQACMCAEKEDCSLLDKMNKKKKKNGSKKSKKPKEKKDPKQGKLKAKKTDHDEL